MRDPVDLRHLEAFQAVVQQGSISRAAAVLGMSQPGLSRLLARLERRLGARLVERGSSGVTPTAAGELLLTRAAAVQDLLRDLPQAVSRAEPSAQVLRIGCYDNSTQTFLPRLAAALPRLTVRLMANRAEIILPMLDRGELDAAIIWDIAADRYRPGPGIRVAPIADEPAWLAVSVNHRLADRPHVSMRQLADETWILSDSPPLQRLITVACERAGFRPRVAHVVGQITTMESLINRGGMVTLAAPTIPDDVAVRRGLRIVPVTDAFVRRVFIAWSTTDVPRPTAETIIDQTRRHYVARADLAPTYAAMIHAHPERFPHLPISRTQAD